MREPSGAHSRTRRGRASVGARGDRFDFTTPATAAIRSEPDVTGGLKEASGVHLMAPHYPWPRSRVIPRRVMPDVLAAAGSPSRFWRSPPTADSDDSS